jgi:hypothetical protein
MSQTMLLLLEILLDKLGGWVYLDINYKRSLLAIGSVQKLVPSTIKIPKVA